MITLDHNTTKKLLVDLFEQQFGTKLPDSYESGYLGYLIEALTFLTTDILYYQKLSYNEAFVHLAKLPSSIINFAKMFNYKPRSAVPASGVLTVSFVVNVPELYFEIPLYTKVGSDIPYHVTKKYEVSVKNLTNVKIIEKAPNGIIQHKPYKIERIPNSSSYKITFDIDIEQISFFEKIFEVDEIYLNVFYEKILSGLEQQISKIIVFVDNEIWYPVNTLYSATPADKAFEYYTFDDKLVIRFGNGIFGKQPRQGALVKVVLVTTLGKSGNVVANSLKINQQILDSQGRPVSLESTNVFDITNGQDQQTYDEIKACIIANNASQKRLVTFDDYKNLNQIIPELKTCYTEAFLTRRDISVNEIDVFITWFDKDEKPRLTTTETITVSNTIIPANTQFTIDNLTFFTPFKIIIEPEFKFAKYIYQVSDIDIVPQMITTPNFTDLYLVVSNINAKTDSQGNVVITYELVGDYDKVNDCQFEFTIDNTPFNVTVGPQNNKLIITLPPHSVPYSACTFVMKIYYNDNIYAQYVNTNIYLAQNLSSILWSTAEPLGAMSYKIYNVPLIKQPIDKDVDMQILNRFALLSDKINQYKMLTDQINFKFARTVGKVKNVKFNTYNSMAVKTYNDSFDVDIPLKFELNVILKSTINRPITVIEDDIKDAVLFFVNKRLVYHRTLTRSLIEKFIHDTVPEVLSCTIVKPNDDIIYDFSLSNLTSIPTAMIRSFVPEMLWTMKELITVRILKPTGGVGYESL